MRARTLVRGMLAAGLTIGLQLATTQIPFAQQTTPSGAPATEAPQANRGGGRGAVDPRVQQRTYMFEDSNEQMPYALFVSSKVNKDKKNPLIVSLHGLGGDQNTMVRESLRSVELAEQGGYILVAPMGGWYGIPQGPPRPGRSECGSAAGTWCSTATPCDRRNRDHGCRKSARGQRKGCDERARHGSEGIQCR
jgi:hypothetical protein